MELAISLPGEWSPARRAGDTRSIEVSGSIELVLYPLTAMPEPRGLLQAAALEARLPAGGKVRVVEQIDEKSDRGWPIRMIESQVIVNEEVREVRLTCVYYFLEYGGAAVVHAKSSEALAAMRDRLVAALTSGWPDWRGPVPALHALWEGITWD